jgi:hypothetical protein
MGNLKIKIRPTSERNERASGQRLRKKSGF